MTHANEVRFHMRGRYYPAYGVASIVQVNENDVEVRYSTRSETVIITNTTVERVIAAINRAKANADSA